MSGVILTTAAAVTANQAIVDERIITQGFPATVAAQIGNKLVAIRATNLGVRVFGAKPREDGSMRIRLSLSGRNVDGKLIPGKKGDNFNFKVQGWITVYPAGMEVPGFIAVADADWSALEYFETYKSFSASEKANKKKPNAWFEGFSDNIVYVMIKLDEASHYVKDALGNKVADPSEDGGWALETHLELQLVAAYFEATLSGQESSGGGVAFDVDAMAAAKAALEAAEAAELAEAASRHAV